MWLYIGFENSNSETIVDVRVDAIISIQRTKPIKPPAKYECKYKHKYNVLQVQI